MTDEQINKLAIGSEESKTKFIWVLRDTDKGDNFAEKGRRVGFATSVLRQGWKELELLSEIVYPN